MGKKARGRKTPARDYEEEHEEDHEEEKGEKGEDTEEKLKNALDDCLDLIDQKRCSSREKGLSSLASLLSHSYCESILDNKRETMKEILMKSIIKSNSETESIQALRCLYLVAVTLGVEYTESLFKEVGERLCTMITKGDIKADVKVECISCLSALCFVGCDEKEGVVKVLKVLSSLWAPEIEESEYDVSPSSSSSSSSSSKGKKKNITFDYYDDEDDYDYEEEDEDDDEEEEEGGEKVKERALGCWVALVGCLEVAYVCDVLVPMVLPSLSLLLEEGAVGMRVRAGEAVALLFYVAREHYEDDFDFELFEDDIDVEELFDRMQALAQKNDRRTAKKDKVEQRRAFRSYCSVVESGGCDPEVITIQHQRFTFNCFKEMVTLRFCRSLLGQGFHVHFGKNELIHDICLVDVKQNKKRTKMSGMTQPKSWTKNRQNQRKIRANQKALAYAD